MPVRPRHFTKQPRYDFIRETVSYDQFTDGGSTDGTYQMQGEIPANARVLGSVIIPVTGFTGDTTATVKIGDGSDDDRYTTGTPSVFTTGTVTIAAGVPSGTALHVAAIRPTITVTSGSDWGAVTAGRMYVEISFIRSGY